MARPTPPRARVYRLLIAAVLAASAAAHVVHDIPRNELRRRHPDYTSLAVAPPFVPKFDAEQMDYLNAHNDFRRSMGMPPLLWDPIVATAAHKWAVKRRRDCRVRRHSKTPYGENNFVMNYREFTPREVVQIWFNENSLYDAATQRCKCIPERAGCECGHFLNIVWRTTVRMGCSGAVYCDDQKGTYIVCDYDPPGLTPGINPFTGQPI